jgi:phosphoribosylformimino-5-aminoimidazole carboxamide ribotide isomerase
MIEIIPAIDIIDGKCVRLSQGNYAEKKVYNENPLEVAKMFEDAGITRLHLVDLDGAKAKHVINHQVLQKIASSTSLLVDFGGGVKTDEDIQLVFDCGATQVTVGSIAVSKPALFERWLELYGPEKIILGADAKNGKIAISGWLDNTAVDLMDFIEKYTLMGVKYVLCTDIAKDGMLQGTSVELYKEIQEKFPDINLIASGGVTTIDEIRELEEAGIYGAVIGKAIYEGKISLEDLEEFL